MNHGATVLNLASIIEHHARLTPEKEAIICLDKRLTYGELNSYANKVANALRKLGIQYGDKVALSCPNLPFFPIVYYGILKAGAVVVPLNVLFKPREIAYHIADSDSKAFFVFEGTNELPVAQMAKEAFDKTETCKELIIMTSESSAKSPFESHPTIWQLIAQESADFETYPTAPHDTCSILYTSGTTGQPKGAELSHMNVYFNSIVAWNLHITSIGIEKDKQYVCLITLPLFHTTGQTAQMNAQFYAGNKIVLLPRFEPQAFLETVRKEKVNFWTGVPTMYWAILKHVEENKIDVSPYAETMLIMSSGGAPMPVEVMKKFEQTFGVRVLEGYGLSETSPIVSFNHPQLPSKPGTVGQPVFGVEVKCVDDNDNEVPRGERGEIVVRGHNVMKGYYKRPEDTAEAMKNGWFHTGDIGIIDEEGYISIVDRKKEMILRGGYNIYPRELEEVIMTHPEVSLCAVIGVPDERLGEEIKAYVVRKQGSTLTEEEFIEWCKTQFAANKYPRYVEFRDSLPISGTGKILKRMLKEELAGK
ncbi:MAG: long-chain fatty acid--CoA ligase [Pyrinomonadaceae bacterium]|nr:long-chain fatty acid--CoA ligase [Pyrinomonadaceae bacterium]MCX7640631.1 long-chain fatty acid--CoA ligase [Pyrinomonadaceae bacterium]MDW8305332.1 long-chain fatty acid--CoA ligase [Acidobacteriota bacterium]